MALLINLCRYGNVMLVALIAKLGLLLGFPGTYALIIIIGFICFNERIYGTTLLLVLFTMIYNYYLKSIWQLPLPPPLEGWAFPSGHMHSAVVFWGWLAYQYRSVGFSLMALSFTALVGFGLVHHGYHYTKDVIGAVGFGALSLVIYALINQIRIIKQKPYLLGTLFIALGSLLMFLLPSGSLKPHLWQAMGGLIGFSFGWFILGKKKNITLSRWRQKFTHSFIAISGVGLIVLLFHFIPLTQSISIFARMLCIALWISSFKLIMKKNNIYFKST